jgi:hypothetical protein
MGQRGAEMANGAMILVSVADTNLRHTAVPPPKAGRGMVSFAEHHVYSSLKRWERLESRLSKCETSLLLGGSHEQHQCPFCTLVCTQNL